MAARYHRKAFGRLFGVSPKTVERWTTLGFLVATPRPPHSKRPAYTAHQAHRFVRNPATWHLWVPDQINDAALYRSAREARGDIVWLTATEAGRRLGYSQHHLAMLASLGVIPTERRGGRWYVRSDQLQTVTDALNAHRPCVPFSDTDRSYVRAHADLGPLELARRLGRRSHAGVAKLLRAERSASPCTATRVG